MRSVQPVFAIIVIFLIPLLTYVTAFYVLSDHRIGGSGARYTFYHIDDERVRKFFAPMDWLDSKFRRWRE